MIEYLAHTLLLKSSLTTKVPGKNTRNCFNKCLWMGSGSCVINFRESNSHTVQQWSDKTTSYCMNIFFLWESFLAAFTDRAHYKSKQSIKYFLSLILFSPILETESSYKTAFYNFMMPHQKLGKHRNYLYQQSSFNLKCTRDSSWCCVCSILSCILAELAFHKSSQFLPFIIIESSWIFMRYFNLNRVVDQYTSCLATALFQCLSEVIKSHFVNSLSDSVLNANIMFGSSSRLGVPLWHVDITRTHLHPNIYSQTLKIHWTSTILRDNSSIKKNLLNFFCRKYFFRLDW